MICKIFIRKDKHKHKQDFRNCYRVHFWTRLNIQSSYSIRRYKNTWTESTIFHVPVISCSTQTKFSWFRLRWNKPKWNDAIYGIWKGKGLETFVLTIEWATSMLVTDVGDEMCWRQLWDVGDGSCRFRHQHSLSLNISVGHQHPKDVTNSENLSGNCHQFKLTCHQLLCGPRFCTYLTLEFPS